MLFIEPCAEGVEVVVPPASPWGWNLDVSVGAVDGDITPTEKTGFSTEPGIGVSARRGRLGQARDVSASAWAYCRYVATAAVDFFLES